MQVRRARLRLIQPFYFDAPDPLADSAGRIGAFVETVRALSWWSLVCGDRVHGHYRVEFLDAVREFLFDNDGDDCRYATLDVTNQFVGNRRLEIWDGPHDEPHLVGSLAVTTQGGTPAVEVWATGAGVGVLSVSLTVEPAGDGGVELQAALDALHRLVHPERHASTKGGVHVVFARPDQPPEHKPCAAIKSLAGSPPRFRWDDFLDACFASLSAHGLIFTLPDQTRLSAYAVFESDDGALDFENQADRDSAGPWLVKAATVQAASHPGLVEADSPLTTVALTRKHLAAAGQMDAAHFVVPQGSAYDEERWLRATRTYFVPYLLATLNHLTYARGLRDLRACVAAPAAAKDAGQQGASPGVRDDPHNRLGELRDRLLAHRLASSFQRISKRENVDRFAASVRRAQGIDASLATLESVIKDKDDLDRSRQNNATFVATLELQSRVEWIEVLLLAVYGLEATHLMSASLGWEATHFQTLSYPVLALAFLVVGFFVVAPHDHRTKISFRRVAWGLLATAAVLVAWALLGLLIHGSDAHGAGSPHALPGGGGRLSPPAAEGPGGPRGSPSGTARPVRLKQRPVTANGRREPAGAYAWWWLCPRSPSTSRRVKSADGRKKGPGAMYRWAYATPFAGVCAMYRWAYATPFAGICAMYRWAYATPFAGI